MFTYCLHVYFPYGSFDVSSAVSRTRIASSPIRSIFFHGILISYDRFNRKNPLDLEIINAVISPLYTSNSKSHGHPRFTPSHIFITSFSLNSHVLNLSIKNLPYIVLYKIYAREICLYSFIFYYIVLCFPWKRTA